ncbi:MAG TPA: hypothetical protein VGT05_05010 [Patescibacteria group bacterium]|nr:hypothetical protein [Patescibacteria group bacterium]
MNLVMIFTRELHLRKYCKKRFPRIYRFITDFSGLLWIPIGLSLLSLLFLLFTQFFQSFQQWETVQNQRAQLTNTMRLWSSIANTYAGYRDAYFQAATLAYQNHDWKNANIFLQNVLLLDPTFTKAKTLKNLVTIEERE